MAVTLINVFTVPEDQDEAFQKNWKKTSETFSQAPGFIETHLYQITGPGEFRYVNIALWETADDLNTVNKSYHHDEASMPGVKAHPGIYRPFIEMKRDDQGKSA